MRKSGVYGLVEGVWELKSEVGDQNTAKRFSPVLRGPNATGLSGFGRRRRRGRRSRWASPTRPIGMGRNKWLSPSHL